METKKALKMVFGLDIVLKGGSWFRTKILSVFSLNPLMGWGQNFEQYNFRMAEVSYLKINERLNVERPILQEWLKYKMKNKVDEATK